MDTQIMAKHGKKQGENTVAKKKAKKTKNGSAGTSHLPKRAKPKSRGR